MNFKLLIAISLLFVCTKKSIGQTVEKIQNTCRIQNVTNNLVETGFLGINDSTIITNYGDSALILCLSNQKIIRKFDFNIVTLINGSVQSFDRNENFGLLENNILYFRAKFSNNQQTWFCKMSSNYVVDKLCRIETGTFIFKKIKNNFFALTQQCEFYNNGSNSKTTIPQGIIKFSLAGLLIDNKEIIPNEFLVPILINDSNQLYMGTIIGNKYTQLYIFDSMLNEKGKYYFEGYSNHISLYNDSLSIQGSTSSLKIPNVGAITNPINSTFHFRLRIMKNLTGTPSICTLTGSGGYGGYDNGSDRPALFYIDNNGFTYLPYSGTVFLDKPYTSSGGRQNFLLGYSSKHCEPNKIVPVFSQVNLWCNLADAPNYKIISISNQNDFFIGNTRHQGSGVYYFLVDTSGVADLSHLSRRLQTESSSSQKKSIKFSISPNPTSSHISCIFPIQTLGEKVEIYDIYGNLMVSENINYQNQEIGLENCKDGIYFITIKSADLITIPQKFILQKK
jgi:hypothetical protein